MSCAKKSQILWWHGFFDFFYGILIIGFSFILLKNFLYALAYLFVLTSFSCLNIINLAKHLSPLSFCSSLINFEDEKSNLSTSKKNDRKEFSLLRCTFIVSGGIFIYYVFAVLYGAPLIESYQSTLYFSCLLVLLSVYPPLWYYFFTDSIVATIKIFLDVKSHSATESHFYTFSVWTVIGAWVGAFPIPLDWDRPWQAWPITCCIGASFGFAAAHVFMGCKLFHLFLKDTRKIPGNRQV